MTDIEHMLGFVSIAESANQTFNARFDAITSAMELKRHAKKSYAYYGLTKTVFSALAGKIEKQLDEVREFNPHADSLNMKYSEFVEAHAAAKRRQQTLDTLAKNAADRQEETNTASEESMQLISDFNTKNSRRRARKWWQFWLTQ